jgi:hypothetical protein
MRRHLVAATVLCVVLASATVLAGPATAGDGASDPPEVEVLDEGDGPKQELRFAIPSGEVSTVTLTLVTEIRQTQGDASQSAKTPPIEFPIEATTTEVSPQGDMTIGYSYGEARIEDDGSLSVDDLDQIREQLDGVAGITGTITISPEGVLLDSTIDTSGVDPTTRRLLEQLSGQASQLTVPLPEPAVGEGARWAATSTLDAGGITFRQTVRYALRDLDGEKVTLDVRVSQRARRQEIDAPGGSGVELLGSRAEGRGKTVIDLTVPLPTSSNISLEQNQRLRAQGEALSQRATTDVNIETAG